MATLKQRKAAEILAGRGGSVASAMIEAGYAEITADTPQKLTESKGWQELMGKVLSDEVLTKKHQELLNASGIDYMTFPKKITDEEIRQLLSDANCQPKKFVHSEKITHVWFFTADNQARQKALDMAYKLKGLYQDGQKKPQVHVVMDLKQLGDLARLADKLDQDFTERFSTGIVSSEPQNEA